MKERYNAELKLLRAERNVKVKETRDKCKEVAEVRWKEVKENGGRFWEMMKVGCEVGRQCRREVGGIERELGREWRKMYEEKRRQHKVIYS